MRVSEYFGLDRTQPTLDFVDVDITVDVPLFIDPLAIRGMNSDWSSECSALLEDFFQTVIEAIKNADDVKARTLLEALREPNETHLGLSANRSQGRAIGRELARSLWEALRESQAVKSGVVQELEDTVLFVPNVDADRVSDIATNIVREPLIDYTQTVCFLYGIPLTPDVDSGPMWDPNKGAWYNKFVSLPMAGDAKVLLIPKAIVRKDLAYDAGVYYRHYILEQLQREELSNPNSRLVEVLKNGRHRVTKKQLMEKYGTGKIVNEQQTLRVPEVLDRYRSDVRLKPRRLLTHEELAEREGTPPPDWAALVAAVQEVGVGQKYATAYENAIEQLVSALFYPWLTNPEKQSSLHGGRKRVDITYTNAAQDGFFCWLTTRDTVRYIFVECKNYSGDPANPELDQLSGRFSRDRGNCGLLICRKFDNKELFLERCRDTAQDGRGFIIALDDSDLIEIAKCIESHDYEFKLLFERFKALVM